MKTKPAKKKAASTPAKGKSAAKAARPGKPAKAPAGSLDITTITPDANATLERVLAMMAIPGKSGQESKIMQFICKELRKAGLPASALVFDQAFKKSPLGGEIGNLIVKLPGTIKGPRRLLMAHVDTVPLCVGCKPVRKADRVVSADPKTGLGADDRAGAAVVLTAALEILRRKLPHPPLTFFWPVQEEVGLNGARHVKVPLLGSPKLAFNWDGGAAEKVTLGATGAYRLDIAIHGKASHAGGAPEKGISAITAASIAIAHLQAQGYLGDVHKDGKHGTSNVGVFQAGEATNVVTPEAWVRAEVRSHDPDFRALMKDAFELAFQTGAAAVTNISDESARAEISSRHDYESFLLPQEEPCVQAAAAAVRSTGLEPQFAVTNGGLDANWMVVHGIPTVTMGCGQNDVHTVNEWLDIPAFQKACTIGLRLALGLI